MKLISYTMLLMMIMIIIIIVYKKSIIMIIKFSVRERELFVALLEDEFV